MNESGKTLKTEEHKIGDPLCKPVRGLQSAADPSYNGGWATSNELHTSSAGAPYNWYTAGDENLS
jgi:hypothetical protein